VHLKILGIITKWIFILCLPILFLSASLAWGFNSLWLYEYGFQKYNVSQTTGLTSSELQKTAQSLIDYFKFNSRDEYVQVTLVKNGQLFELFTQEEQIHFKDVRELVWPDYRVLLATLIIVLTYAVVSIFWRHGRYRRQLARSVIWGSGLAIVLIIITAISSALDFDQLFLDFHLLAFSNQYWSAQGYMLLLFPGGFWYDAAFICLAIVAALAVVLGIVALLYLRLSKTKNNLRISKGRSD
jgi:integral membrane protein (TIGR01906 family)